MILALNGVPMDAFGNFGEFGAASASVASLQTALANFGRQIGDAALKAIKVDGLIGPKTTAAANRALRQHIGAGQAPQDLRTGVLTQAQVLANATQITTLINTEARRRGFGIATAPATVKKPAAKKVAAKTTAVATYIPPAASAPSAAAQAWPTYGPPMPATPAPTQTLIPTSRTYVVPPSSGMDIESVVKWSAIGLGVVALLGGAYYVVQKRRGQAAMAGFGGLPSCPHYFVDTKRFGGEYAVRMAYRQGGNSEPVDAGSTLRAARLIARRLQRKADERRNRGECA